LPFIIISGVFLLVSFAQFLNLLPFKINPDPAWAAIIICGIPMLYLAIYRVIFQRFISSALLISIAMVAAISINEIFAAGEVAFIMSLGGFLEEKTLRKARKGIEKLISLAPMLGRKVIQNPGGSESEEMVKVELLRVGDIVRVLPGEAMPADGVIVSGNTSVDQSILTGESLPSDKEQGDEVFAGTINRFGTADIEVRKQMENSTLHKMVQLVKEAETGIAPTQKVVDKFAEWLVPFVLLLAIAVYMLTGEIVRGVVILIVFCPCALALATPTSIIAAIGQAAKFGVLIKSGEALEKMGKVNVITFDKTGTLTHGKLTVSDIIPASGFTEDELLTLAASVEARSEHPLGKAVTVYAKEKGLLLNTITDFTMSVGKGVQANINDEPIFCGSINFLYENKIKKLTGKEANEIGTFQEQGKAVIAIAKGNNYIGLIALADVYRDEATDMLKNLSAVGVKKTILLSGDNKKTAAYVASQIGLTDVRSELLPADKVSHIKNLQNDNEMVCMVGDGVNDAPALKTADVGIAMGCMGSDIAIEAADIALMGEDISKIPYIKALSNATVRSIKVNIFLSMFINVIAIYLSIVGLIGPVAGALFHNIGSVLVVLNAARLYDKKIMKGLK
jgi:heavy metal translocating P-type ATPase